MEREAKWDLEGQQLRYCGVGAGFDDVIVDGNLDELKVIYSDYMLSKPGRTDLYYSSSYTMSSRTKWSLLPGTYNEFSCDEYRLNGAYMHTFSIQRDPVVSKASELLRLGLMPSPDELRAGKVSYLKPLPLTIVDMCRRIFYLLTFRQ